MASYVHKRAIQQTVTRFPGATGASQGVLNHGPKKKSVKQYEMHFKVKHIQYGTRSTSTGWQLFACKTALSPFHKYLFLLFYSHTLASVISRAVEGDGSTPLRKTGFCAGF